MQKHCLPVASLLAVLGTKWGYLLGPCMCQAPASAFCPSCHSLLTTTLWKREALALAEVE